MLVWFITDKGERLEPFFGRSKVTSNPPTQLYACRNKVLLQYVLGSIVMDPKWMIVEKSGFVHSYPPQMVISKTLNQGYNCSSTETKRNKFRSLPVLYFICGSLGPLLTPSPAPNKSLHKVWCLHCIQAALLVVTAVQVFVQRWL